MLQKLKLEDHEIETIEDELDKEIYRLLHIPSEEINRLLFSNPKRVNLGRHKLVITEEERILLRSVRESRFNSGIKRRMIRKQFNTLIHIAYKSIRLSLINKLANKFIYEEKYGCQRK